VAFLSSSPVGDLEALEESSGSSVEVNITHALQQGVWVEVLSIDVELNVRLLVEFIVIEVLNSYTYIILN
jgi:hypothetical protein